VELVLMPNHVHLILVPEHVDAVHGALSKVHRAYAGRIHAREKRTGHFWQGRFGCVAMDEPHLLAAVA
jgi:putative transposase